MTTAQDLITKVADGFQGKLDSLNLARDRANLAAGVAEQAFDDLTDNTTQGVIIWDPLNGDDNLDGVGTANAVKNWYRVCELMPAGRRAIVHVLQDCLADRKYIFNTPPSLIEIRGRSADNSTFLKRKLTFVDDAVNPVQVGGLGFNGSAVLSTYYLDVVAAHNRDESPVRSYHGGLIILNEVGSLIKNGTGGSIFTPSGHAHFRTRNFPIDPSASGHVINLVAAGADPNDVNGISANFEIG